MGGKNAEMATMRPKTEEELKRMAQQDAMMAHASRFMPNESRQYRYDARCHDGIRADPELDIGV